MNKLAVLGIVMLIFASCSTATQTARQTEQAMRGTWVLNEIVNDQQRNVAVTQLFDHASLECFTQSEWTFVANNSTGNYWLSGDNCPQGQNNISWHTSVEDGATYFWFKRLDGERARNVTSGYKMRVVSADASQIHLMHEIPSSEGSVNLHYYFTKK
ncbi:MAG: lipocalin family protein [Weeksellaceae bacterium]|nr:lipocalin family protein [Weeksellaceae bacterium]